MPDRKRHGRWYIQLRQKSSRWNSIGSYFEGTWEEAVSLCAVLVRGCPVRLHPIPGEAKHNLKEDDA